MRPALVCLGLLVGAIWVGGCLGGGEREFDAESAVATLNDAGADLELGGPLEAADESIEVWEVKFTGGTGPVGGDGHGSGAVVVLDDAELAEQEFFRCEGGPSFVCFRAANTVFRFIQISDREQTRITASLRAIAD